MLKSEINNLILKGAISKVKPCRGQFLSSYFLVDKSNGKKRFILNLKKLNEFIDPPHFKMEDLKTAIRLISPRCFMTSIDLEDAYTLISVHPDFRKYLRFQFGGQLFESNTLPFGLCTAPYMFTKILKPVSAHWRSKGFVSVIYLDDFLFIDASEKQSIVNVSYSKSFLESLGFIINAGKSQLSPVTIIRFLGFLIDSREYSVSLPVEKREKILEFASSLNNSKSCSILELAQFIGTLVSACPAVKYGFVHTKVLERAKFLALASSRDDYSANMYLDTESKQELTWWISTLSNAKSSNRIRDQTFALEIFSDSSKKGWGAFVNQREKTLGWWSEDQKKEHINYLELQAAFFGLKCFASELSSCQILLRIDNTTALSYVNKMGGIRYPKLASLARQIWYWAKQRDLWLCASYIKSGQNIDVDFLSRQVSEGTEWELSIVAFQKIAKTFGPFDIDLFATNINAKCESFISRFPDPEAAVVDAFTVSWTNFYFYAFPPFSLILRALNKVICDKAEGVMVVPKWPSQPWFPLFKKLLISEPVFIGPHSNSLSSPFSSRHPMWKSLILVAGRLSARPSP